MTVLDKFILFGVVMMGMLIGAWGLVSFVSWDVTWLNDIAEWHSFQRFALVVFGTVTVLISGMAVVCLDDD